MAQSGYTPILIYGSGTTGNAPTAGNLTSSSGGAELALNYFDGKLFYKDASGVVQVLATKGTGTVGGSNTQVQYNSSGALAGSANLTFNGTTLTAAGLTTTGALQVDGNSTLGNASTDTVQVNGYMGVGGAGTANTSVYVTPTALTGTSQYGIYSTPRVSSAGTSQAAGLTALVRTEAAAFTLTNLYGVSIENANKGAGSTITNQHGLYIADQTQGTNNYGITSLVSSGSNKWNIYASGTANNAFAGNVRIGSTTAPTNALDVTGSFTVSDNVTLGDASTDTVRVNGTIGIGAAASSAVSIQATSTALTGTAQGGFYADITGTSAATSEVSGFRSTVRTAAAAFTVSNVSHFRAFDATKGAGSTITNQHGLYVADQTQGTNNFGVTSLVSSGSNKWNIYASGTAANYFAGNVGIGTTNIVGSALGSNGKALSLSLESDINGNSASASVNIGAKLISFSGIAGPSNYVAASLALHQTGSVEGIGEFRFSTGDGAGTLTERMRLDSVGNLGLGVTPNAWDTTEYRAMQIGLGASFYGRRVAGDADKAGMAANAVFDQTDNRWEYIATDSASRYDQTGGGHYWYSAASGTAGAAITFTDAMALDASGNLGVGVIPAGWTNYKAIGLNGQGAYYYALTASSTSGLSGNGYYNGTNWIYSNSQASGRYEIAGAQHSWFSAASGTAGNTITFTEAMRLDASGNLGLGVTPSAKLDVAAANFVGGPAIGARYNTSNARIGFNIANANGFPYIGYNTNNANGSDTPTYDLSQAAAQLRMDGGQFRFNIAPSGTAGTAITFTQAMTLDASGNLGLGVTPSAWDNRRAIQNGAASFASSDANRSVAELSANSYLSTGGTFRYIYSSANASLYQQATGEHRWYTAPSGTAGNNVSFTERARITESGNQITYQSAESAQNTSVTLSVANLQARIITSNAAVTLTLPTGTTLEGYTTSMAADTAFEVTFIATTANAITIAANGNTTVGSLTVAGNTSGTFRFRKTATNTFTVYRVS